MFEPRPPSSQMLEFRAAVEAERNASAAHDEAADRAGSDSHPEVTPYWDAYCAASARVYSAARGVAASVLQSDTPEAFVIELAEVCWRLADVNNDGVLLDLKSKDVQKFACAHLIMGLARLGIVGSVPR